MKTRLPWRAHSPSGWAQACADANLGILEEWALLRLLDRQWERGWLPASVLDIAALLRADGLTVTLAKQIKLLPLLDRFFPIQQGDKTRRQNPDLAAERDRAQKRQEAFSKRGQAGAAAVHGDGKASLEVMQ